MDTSTRNGKFMAQSWPCSMKPSRGYVSQRTKAAAAYLRAQGKSVGATPFGTVRNEEGFQAFGRGSLVFQTGQFVKGARRAAG